MSGERFAGIDAARGFAVLAMIQTHAYDGWVSDGERSGLVFRLTRVIGTLPLPMFLMLAGIGLVLRAHGDATRGRPTLHTRQAIGRSALKVVAAGYGLAAFYALLNGARTVDAALRPDVLHAIGLSLFVLALFAIGSKARVSGTAALLTLVPVAACPFLTDLGKGVSGPWRHVAGLLVEVPGVGHMPLVPLISFCAAGVGVGTWLVHGHATRTPSVRTRRNLLALALCGCVLTISGVMSSEWARAQGVLISRSHPSIALNVIDLDGRAALAIALTALLLPLLGRARPLLVACGRHSLFLYGLHLPFCYGRLARPFKRDLSMTSSTLLLLGLSVFCVSAALLLEHLRVTRARKSAIP